MNKLIQKAKSRPARQVAPFNDTVSVDEQELVLAFFRGEINLNDLGYAIDLDVKKYHGKVTTYIVRVCKSILAKNKLL